jgi:SAM-dependent methyltransferase
LKLGADNAEGLEIPAIVRRQFRSLPRDGATHSIPNYIASWLEQRLQGASPEQAPTLDTFTLLWSQTLAACPLPRPLPSVLEPACGSANDYRFLQACGIARLIDYAGVDLCPANIENARTMFPGASFDVGNVFELPAADRADDLCFVHDLFEHLSPAGIETAIAEICRVTCAGLCLNFFNMDEIPTHRIEPFEEYHWNLLSLETIRDAFRRHGFEGQAIHIGTWLRAEIGCPQTHNPNAYTMILQAGQRARRIDR